MTLVGILRQSCDDVHERTEATSQRGPRNEHLLGTSRMSHITFVHFELLDAVVNTS
jgi:hypothetical protein